MATEVWTAIGSIATAFIALLTLAAAAIALKAAKFAGQQAKLLREQVEASHAATMVEVHSRFQSEIRALQRAFPPTVSNADWVPTATEARSVQLYWYLVFDEWLTCTKMGSELGSLWTQHYSEGVKSALRLPVFRLAAEELFRGSSTFLGYGLEFKKEIEALCFAATGKPLKP